MSLNDTSLAPNKAVDIPDGLSNPTPSSVLGNPKKDNYVDEPSDEGAQGNKQETSADSSSSTTSGESASAQANSLLQQAGEAAKSAIDSVTGTSK